MFLISAGCFSHQSPWLTPRWPGIITISTAIPSRATFSLPSHSEPPLAAFGRRKRRYRPGILGGRRIEVAKEARQEAEETDE